MKRDGPLSEPSAAAAICNTGSTLSDRRSPVATESSNPQSKPSANNRELDL